MSSQKDEIIERLIIFGCVQIRPRKLSFWDANDKVVQVENAWGKF